MKYIWLVLLLASAVFMTGQDPSGDGPPPEPPADRPACNNYHDTPVSHRCACGKAMRCEGHLDEPPDASTGQKWCSQYCVKSKCKCVGPCETHRHTGARNAE